MPFPNPPAAGVLTLTAANTSMTVGGTATAKTVATGTLDLIASQEPPAGSVAFNAQKITGLANGSAATDGAAFGQIPTTIYGIGGITSAAGVIGSNVTLTHNATTKVMDTASLGIGTWLLTFICQARLGFGATADTTFSMVVDSATATFSGVQAGSLDIGLTAASDDQQITLCAIVTVTGAGTIKLQAANADTAADAVARSVANDGSTGNVTGYTAIRIA